MFQLCRENNQNYFYILLAKRVFQILFKMFMRTLGPFLVVAAHFLIFIVIYFYFLFLLPEISAETNVMVVLKIKYQTVLTYIYFSFVSIFCSVFS